MNAHFLRCTENLPLLANCTSIDGTDEDRNALQVLFQPLEIVGQAPNANIDARRLQALCGGLSNGRRADQHRNTLCPFNRTSVVAREDAY